jgi:hypothetical protein
LNLKNSNNRGYKRIQRHFPLDLASPVALTAPAING